MNAFHTRRKQVPVYWDTLTVQGHVFKRFGEAKYLGVILDENLTWNAHVNSLTGTLRKYASSFKLNKNQIPKTCKKKNSSSLPMFIAGYNMALKSMGMHVVET